MVGLLIGSFVFGLASDKFGRLKTMMVAIVIVTVSGLQQQWNCRTVLQFPRRMMNARVQVRPSQSIWPG